MKKFEFYTICVLITLIILVSLIGCAKKEKYPNKMDTIAKALTKLKK